MTAYERENFYRDKRVLVTGSTGYLASNLLGALRDTGCFIRRLSRSGSRFVPMPGKAVVEDLTGEMDEASTWRQAMDGIDMVFHFASQTSVYAANEDPLSDHRANVLPIVHMLETCRRTGQSAIVLYSGTVTEAGITSMLPVDETHEDAPVTVYDLHKLTAENYLKYYVRLGVVDGAVLRLSNVYGPGPESGGRERGVLNGMIRRALSGEPLTIYGDGNYMRDYIYVGDVVEAFLRAGAAISEVNGHHYVIGSGKGHTVSEAVHLVAEHVRQRSGRKVSVVHVTPPRSLSPIEKRHFVANSARFSAATGWSSGTPLSEGVDLTIDYYSGEAREAL
jgi:nucleoside-diphosphate-sugar epimerase